MKRINLGQPGPDPTEWIMRALREIEQASEQENALELFDAYTITPPAAEVRTLDPATATVGDLAAFVATLVLDMQRRGQGRVE